MARRSKRTRNAQQGGSQQAAPPPFPYPEGPRGFRLRWLNTKDEGDPDAFFVVDKNSGTQKIGQFARNLPKDLMERSQWIERHIPSKGQPRHPMTETPIDWCATMWHGLHHGWQFHRERGIQGFMSHQIEMMGGLEEVAKLGGMFLSVTLLPEGTVKHVFPEPHIVLAVEPDGEFCRLLATEYWGIVAIGIAAERDMDTILGPISVGLMGTVLVDGKPYPQGSEGLEPTLMLIDPLTVLADLGPVAGTSPDGMLEYMDKTWDMTTMGRLYHPDDSEARRFMHHSQRGFLDLWDGKVPGFVGKIGTLHHKIKEAEARQARLPVNPQYMEALERELETARFMRANHPIATVQRELRRPPHRVDYDAVIAEGLESATTHYWTGHMCDLLERSYGNLPEWWLRPQEVGPRRGYCWFSTPISLEPDDPEVLRAMMWMVDPDTGHYMIVPFTVFQGPRASEYRTTFNTYHGVPRQVRMWKEGQSLTDWLKVEVGKTLDSAAELAGVSEELLLVQCIAWGRIFATAISIMNQVLIKVEPYTGDRTTRRRIERLRPPGLEPPAPIVRAILLRRQYTVQRRDKDGVKHVDWQHQWKVTEHWRQQWYPSLNAHKWILILEHIKGPPDKPLNTPLPLKIVGR